jgi:membrane protease YdiL (CAAX protease family)
MDREPSDTSDRLRQGGEPPPQTRGSLVRLPEPSDRPPGGHYHLLEFLAIFFALFAAELLLRATADWVVEGEYTVLELIATAIRDLGFCLLVWVLLTRDQPFDWRLPRAAVQWVQEFGWALLLILAIFGCNYILSLLIFPLDLESAPTRWANPLGNPAALATFCLFTPIVGLGEELLFRVYVQTRLTQILRGRNILPVLLGTVLFAALHNYALAGTLRVAVIGLVLGVSYQANRKIPRLVVAHTLWNLMVALLTLVPD